MNVRLKPEKYLKYLYLPNLFATKRTGEILSVNPTTISQRVDAEKTVVSVYDYTAETLNEKRSEQVKDVYQYKETNSISWINIDGIRKADVEAVCEKYGIHSLIVEDILSVNQRPKMDEVEGVMYCLLNMLYFYEANKTVETE